MDGRDAEHGCDGRGFTVGPICCGKLNKVGDCLGHCAVPERIECPGCENCTPTPERRNDE